MHGQDLTVSQSGTATPSNAQTKESTSLTATATPLNKAVLTAKLAKVNLINTGAPVTVSGSFMASADDLFAWLTDERKIPVWSRAVAQVRSRLPLRRLWLLSLGEYQVEARSWRRVLPVRW